MDIRFTPRGIYLPAIDLWLDPQERCENSWISHGHSDHARGLHCTVIATPETLRVYRVRWPEEEQVPQVLQPLAYGESMEWRGARLTAYPASHIVGAAQLLIEFQGERIVYTGDIKLRDPICGSRAWRSDGDPANAPSARTWVGCRRPLPTIPSWPSGSCAWRG